MKSKFSKNKAFTPTPTLALLLSVLYRIGIKCMNLKKAFSSVIFSRRNKNTMPKLVSGFTLVETLMAISILSLSIVGTFTAVQNGLQNSSTAKDQTVAFYLAQEAMEDVKNIRDNNALYTIGGATPIHGWLYGVAEGPDDPCRLGQICLIDALGSQDENAHVKMVRSCGVDFGSCELLRQDPLTGLFGYDQSWPESIFRREIQITPIVADREVKVTIKMSWDTRWGERNFQVSETLFNRQ